jgi:hypothetical protein
MRHLVIYTCIHEVHNVPSYPPTPTTPSPKMLYQALRWPIKCQLNRTGQKRYDPCPKPEPGPPTQTPQFKLNSTATEQIHASYTSLTTPPTINSPPHTAHTDSRAPPNLHLHSTRKSTTQAPHSLRQAAPSPHYSSHTSRAGSDRTNRHSLHHTRDRSIGRWDRSLVAGEMSFRAWSRRRDIVRCTKTGCLRRIRCRSRRR